MWDHFFLFFFVSCPLRGSVVNGMCNFPLLKVKVVWQCDTLQCPLVSRAITTVSPLLTKNETKLTGGPAVIKLSYRTHRLPPSHTLSSVTDAGALLFTFPNYYLALSDVLRATCRRRQQLQLPSQPTDADCMHHPHLQATVLWMVWKHVT